MEVDDESFVKLERFDGDIFLDPQAMSQQGPVNIQAVFTPHQKVQIATAIKYQRKQRSRPEIMWSQTTAMRKRYF